MASLSDISLALADRWAALPALIEGAQTALEQVRTIEDALTVSIQRLTRGLDGARELHNRAGEIKIGAERWIGRELRGMEMNTGGRPGKTGDTRSPVSPDKLEDLGLSHKQSSRYQQLASVPEADLHSYFESMKQDGGEITTAGALRFASTRLSGSLATATRVAPRQVLRGEAPMREA